MKLFQNYAAISLIGFVLIGSLFLTYMQSIDGVFIFKPAIFDKGIDIRHMKTDKEVYHRGDIVSIYTSYCRTRNFEAKTTWRLIDTYQITLAEKDTVNTVGCTKDKWIPIGPIPQYAVMGVHHLEGVSLLVLNGVHTIPITFISQEFQVQ